MRRRIIALILSLILLFSLSGCRSGDYKNAVFLAEAGDWQGAREIFASLEDYKDAADRTTECDYRIALGKMDAGDYDAAREILLSLHDYADSDTLVTECGYRKALSDLDAGRWDIAAAALDALGDYKDSAAQATECRYRKAASDLDAGRWDIAAAAFTELGDYKDSPDMVSECSYRKAEDLLAKERFDEASELFRTLGDYRDSKDQYNLCLYQKATLLYENGEYEAAIRLFLEMPNYRDSEYLFILSWLQYDQLGLVDTFVRYINEMYKATELPLSLTENVAGYERDGRYFTMDRDPGGREVTMTFEPSFSDGSVTSRGQISSIHIVGDSQRESDNKITLIEVVISAVLTMKFLDSNASEDLAVTIGEAFTGMLEKFPDVIPATGYFDKVAIPYEHYECEAAASFWPGYYRFVFRITMPELVKQK